MRTSTRSVDNLEDIIDSRDIIARIDELTDERDSYEPDLEDETEVTDEVRNAAWSEMSPDDAVELKTLLALQDEAEGYADDWRHGCALIRRSYFVDYCRDLVSDIGDMPRDIPNYLVIDWDATASNLEADYTTVDYDGVEYLIR